MTYEQMKAEVLGMSYDIDGAYGAQCFNESVMISLADGSYKSLSDVAKGDQTSFENYVTSNKKSEERYTVRIETGGGVYFTTLDHVYYLENGAQIQAKDVKTGMKLKYDDIEQPEMFKLKADECRFIGAFLAGGALSGKGITLQVDTEERNDYIDGLKIHFKSINRLENGLIEYVLDSSKHVNLKNAIEFLYEKIACRCFSKQQFKYIIESYVKMLGLMRHGKYYVREPYKEVLLMLQYGCILNGYEAYIQTPDRYDKVDDTYSMIIDFEKPFNNTVTSIGKRGKFQTVSIMNTDGSQLFYGDNVLSHNCWDFAGYVFEHYYGGKAISCTSTGYVKDIANNKATNGILDFMIDIPLTEELKAGDVCVWGNCTACPLSHIAIYDHDNGQNEVYFLGQNQPYSYVNVSRIDVKGIIGVFRPKNLTASVSNASGIDYSAAAIPADFTAQNASFKVNVSSINVRSKPDTTSEIVAAYDYGQTVKYDCYRADKGSTGYVWISYIGNSGKRRYLATGISYNGVNKKPWGTFF